MNRLTNMRFTTVLLIVGISSALVYVKSITPEAWAGVVGSVALAFIAGSVASDYMQSGTK
jgi:hypothetical protein